MKIWLMLLSLLVLMGLLRHYIGRELSDIITAGYFFLLIYLDNKGVFRG